MNDSETLSDEERQTKTNPVKHMAKRGRPVTVDRPYATDPYVKKWLTGLDKSTASNYVRQFKAWLDFIEMTPSEQIEKRAKDLQSVDLTERQFFERKWREFKTELEKSKATDSTIKSYLKCVASFFSRNFGKRFGLSLNRGDWISDKPQPMKSLLWIPSQQEIKDLYIHADLREKCLLLCLAQSGLSEVDAKGLRVEDIKDLFKMGEMHHYYFVKPGKKTTETIAACLS